MIYFLIVLITVIVAVFLLPIKVVIYSNIKGKNVNYVDKSSPQNSTDIAIKILRIYTNI